MADVNDNRFELNEIQATGRFGDIAAKLNNNFRLIIEAILKKRDGKSAYELWVEQPGNEGKSIDAFWAYLTADKGFTKQVLTYAEFSALNPQTADTDTIYVYPNADNTEYYNVISNGTSWVNLITIERIESGKNDNDDLSQFFNVVEEQVGGSVNLIDPSKYVTGAILSDGSFSPNSVNYKTTGYIAVEDGETYTFFNVLKRTSGKPNVVCFYSSDNGDDPIYSTPSNSTIVVPTGSYYLRITISKPGDESTLANTGLFKGVYSSSDEIDDYDYSEPETSSHIELNDNGKSIDDKTDDELVTKKNLTDYVEEKIGDIDIPNTSTIEDAIAAIKKKTDLLSIHEEQVGGSTNLLNPDEIEQGAMNSSGGVTDNANYSATGFIEVEEGHTYTFFGVVRVTDTTGTKASQIGNLCKYDADKNFLENGLVAFSPLVSQITIDSGVKYIRLTMSKNYTTFNDGNSKIYTGLIEGENPNFEEYSPKELRTSLLYDVQTSFADKNESEVITKKDIPTDGGGSDEGLGKSLLLNFKKGTGVNHDVITITDGSNNIKCTFDKWDKNQYYRGNHIFNFLSMLYNGKTSKDEDDVPALHAGSGTYLGGNHTTSGQLLTAAAHGLTNSNLGAKFTASNNQEYTIMRVIDSDRFIVLPNSPDVPTGNATINGRQVNITAKSSYEMFPANFGQTQRINIDGKELAIQDSDADANADVVDIVDAYNIVDFGFENDISMQVTGQSSDEKLNNIIVDNIAYTEAPVRARIENIYRFMAGLKALVITNVIFLQDTYFIELGLSMAAPKIVSSDFVGTPASPQNWRMYIPGSTEVSSTGGGLTNSINFAEPTIFTPPAGQYWTYDVNGWADQNKPVNRVIGISKDNVGFALGYVPVGAGANLTNYTTKPFEIHNSGKIYPRTANREGLQASGIMTGFNIPAGTVISGVMYRVPFDAANQSTGRICLYDVDYDGYKYVFIDYNQTIFDHVELDDSFNGHTIELVEQRNAVLTSPVYNGGFYVNATHVSGDSSYCVVKIKL